ncbi:MAG TPA: HWE histidine kinase domain-containing protein [Erythrobacter sp.]|nr:HWE histidine kinase domain-containing protein [Erythrobacter sp.]
MHEREMMADPQARRQAATVQIILQTAGAVGEAFFSEAAETLARVLGVRWVLFGQYQSGNESSAQTIVFWDDKIIAPNRRLPWRSSIWEHLMQSGDCIYPENLHSTFSADAVFGETPCAEGCIGTQLKASDGAVIGFLTILDDKPIANPDWVAEVIALLASRAGAELERLMARSLNERLGKIVEESVSEAYAFSAETFLFETVNRGARENLGYSIEELRRMTPWDLKPAYSDEDFRSFVGPLLRGEVKSMQLDTQHRRKDGSRYDVSVRIQYFPEPDNLFFASLNDVTHRKEAERREKILINEINHRSKNLLSIVQSIAAQTAAANPEDLPERLGRRIAALAANQDVLVHNTWCNIPTNDLVLSQLGFLKHLIGTRIMIEGPDLRLQAGAAQVLGMAIHELATNAIKHGALANNQGTVAISWSQEDKGQAFRFSWMERGGPLVAEPCARGFGSAIIIDQPCYALNANVEALFEAKGFRYSLTAPVSQVLDGSQDATATS